MRQLYASPRVENIERLEAALNELGIKTRVTNRQSFLTGKPYFGYSERYTESRWPALWVVEADDYPRARQMMREAGLIDSPTDQSYFRENRAVEVRPPDYLAKRLRLVLFALVFALAVVTVLRMTVWG